MISDIHPDLAQRLLRHRAKDQFLRYRLRAFLRRTNPDNEELILLRSHHLLLVRTLRDTERFNRALGEEGAIGQLLTLRSHMPEEALKATLLAIDKDTTAALRALAAPEPSRGDPTTQSASSSSASGVRARAVLRL